MLVFHIFKNLENLFSDFAGENFKNQIKLIWQIIWWKYYLFVAILWILVLLLSWQGRPENLEKNSSLQIN